MSEEELTAFNAAMARLKGRFDTHFWNAGRPDSGVSGDVNSLVDAVLSFNDRLSKLERDVGSLIQKSAT